MFYRSFDIELSLILKKVLEIFAMPSAPKTESKAISPQTVELDTHSHFLEGCIPKKLYLEETPALEGTPRNLSC